MAVAMLLICGCKGTTLPNLKAEDGAITRFAGAPYQGGVLLDTDKMLYYVSEKTNELVPFCDEEGCEHKTYTEGVGECRAAELAGEGNTFIVHEDSLWFLVHRSDSTYLWKAETNGKNPERVGSLFSTVDPYSYPIMKKYSFFENEAVVQGEYMYLLEQNFPLETKEEPNPEPVERIVSIRLRDGRMVPITEWSKWSQYDYRLGGVYGEWLYYVENWREEPDRLCRQNVTTGEKEVCFEYDYINLPLRDGQNMAVSTVDSKKNQTYVIDLETGEKQVCEGFTADFYANGKLVWNTFDENTKTYTGHVYHLATGEREDGKPFQTAFIFLAATEKGYVVFNGNQYGYISEKDYLAGKEVKLKTK